MWNFVYNTGQDNTLLRSSISLFEAKKVCIIFEKHVNYNYLIRYCYCFRDSTAPILWMMVYLMVVACVMVTIVHVLSEKETLLMMCLYVSIDICLLFVMCKNFQYMNCLLFYDKITFLILENRNFEAVCVRSNNCFWNKWQEEKNTKFKVELPYGK